MNATTLKAAFTRNRKTLAVLGAVAVAGLAWVARSRTGQDAAATDSSLSTGAQTTGYGAYDSTSSDVYNALQPQIEELQNLARAVPVTDPDLVDAIAGLSSQQSATASALEALKKTLTGAVATAKAAVSPAPTVVATRSSAPVAAIPAAPVAAKTAATSGSATKAAAKAAATSAAAAKTAVKAATKTKTTPVAKPAAAAKVSPAPKPAAVAKVSPSPKAAVKAKAAVKSSASVLAAKVR